MVKVSVIIPVYNAEKYLRECLDSIKNQTLKDIEIICIDDGSTDNSLKILNEYSEDDKRFKIYTQKNMGQGATRNRALKYINGKYFSFMDADDILELNTLETTYNKCEEEQLDMVMYKLINYDDDKKEYYKTPLYDMYVVRKKIESRVFDYKDLKERIFNVSVTPVNKLYNTEFVLNSKTTFPEGIFFEDNIFSWKLIFLAKRIYFINEYFYIRRVHTNSVIGGGSEKWLDAIEIYNQVWSLFKEFGEFENYKEKLYNNKVIFALYRFDNIQEQYKELFFQTFKKDLLNVIDKQDDFIIYLNDKNLKLVKYILSAKDYNDFEIYRNSDILQEESEKIKKETEKIKKLIKQLETDNKQLLYEKENLEKNNKTLKNKLNRTKKENNGLTQFKNTILTSTSWKITAPLRKITSILKKIIKKLIK